MLAHALFAIAAGIMTATTATPVTRTVIVIRHCARATPSTTGSGDPHFRYFDNYTSHPFPPWPVIPYQCLPHGVKIVQAEGANLAALGQGVLSYDAASDLEFVADACDRDNDTAHALVAGIGLSPPPPVTTDAAIFVAGASGDGACPEFTRAQNRKFLTKRFLEVNNTLAQRAGLPPAAWLALVDKLQGVLGRGAAPALADLPDAIGPTGWLNGASSVGGMIVEQFLMQLGDGGGVPVAWGELDAAGVYDAVRLRVFQRAASARVPQVAARAQSNLLYATLNKLNDFSSGNGTTFYVGHDTNLDQLASLLDTAGLIATPGAWQAGPYPADATPPGSALVFRATRDSDDDDAAGGAATVSVQFMSAALDGSNGGDLAFDTVVDAMPLASFAQQVTAALDMKCVTK